MGDSLDLVIHPQKIRGFFVDSEVVDLGWFLCAKKEAVFVHDIDFVSGWCLVRRK